MTFRKPQLNRKSTSRKRRASGVRERLRKRLAKRHSLMETLETRQLLAGPDLIGIQPSEGTLLNDGTVLSVSPRELVFRFDDDTVLDADTLSAIRISRAGEDRVFEAASATTDLGTSGQVLVEFRSRAVGATGNGQQVTLTSSLLSSSLPNVTVLDGTVSIEVNNNPNNPTRVRDLISAVENNAEANALLEVIQVSGPSGTDVGTTLQPGTLTLEGANAAEALTDFGTNGQARLRLVSRLSGADGRDIQVEIEQRIFGGAANPVVVVTDQTVRVELNSTPGFESTVQDFIDAIQSNPDSNSLLSLSLVEGNTGVVIGGIPPSFSPLLLSGVSDVVVEPGFVGLGDSPREIVFRFAEPLPDDIYQIEILGAGPVALLNAEGERFQDGENLSTSFSINLGPQVVAVVPEPVRRNSNGGLSPQTGTIEVHFNNDDLAPALAENPAFYQLVFTDDTVRNTDDVVITPVTVDYNNITNIATLDFQRPLSRIQDPSSPNEFLTGAARLRVGASEGLAQPPSEVSLAIGTTEIDPGDSFSTAFDLNTQWTINGDRTQSATLRSEIFNTEAFSLDLPGPDLPGVREIRPDDPTRLTRTVPLDFVRNGADVVDGISVIQYNFVSSFLGDDPNRPGITNDTTYFNLISEQQKVRVREALQLFSEYLGVNFVEVEGDPTNQAFFSIAVGDLFGADPTINSGDGGVAVVTADRNADGIDDLAVLDFQDFDESIDDQFGGEFFRGAMFAVGQLLGFGFADSLPQPVTQSTSFIFQPGVDNEPAFPSAADIVHGQFLYRPDSIDIDLYRFSVDTAGDLSVEAIAERLGVPSLLDTALRLYRADSSGSFVEIAQNDDYFSNDSFVDVRIGPGTYAIGVSAKGNTNYDPAIEGTGFGGLSEGDYELRLEFQPLGNSGLADTTGVALDGDNDGLPGGFFDFWFVPSDPNNTLYVDKLGTSSGGQLGTVGNPYREIDQAIAASREGDTIRVVGNGGIDGLLETPEDNFSYQIGFSNNGLPLADGTSLDLPQGVQLVVDSGAILKFSRSRIGVGSVSPLIDVSNSSLQILGTPTIVGANGLPARDGTNALIPGSVFLTSINDDTVGVGNVSGFTPEARPGDWGGIDFRGDLDSADELRTNREDDGVFLNHIQYGDFRYGGGSVSIGGQQVVVSPIDLAVTRPTIINSRITDSSDAAISATPDTFLETRFTEAIFQADGVFTPDYDRVGPDIHGNFIADNSINGLFIRLQTRTGTELESITSSTRLDDTDIVHVLTENLVVEGTPGGPVLNSTAPSSLLVRFDALSNGTVPAGTYVYSLTNVDSSGVESAASQPTIPVTLNSQGSIRLNQLPTITPGSDFISRNLYRAEVDPVSGLPGTFRLVEQLNASNTSFVDQATVGTTVLPSGDNLLRSRLDASLKIDPGTVLKLDGARIEATFGADIIAEGTSAEPIVFTSLEDQRYGTGGTFDTNNRLDQAELNPGDWGGIYIGAGAAASIDNAVIAGAGGVTRIEGGFASFNAIELHQGTLRLTNSLLESNADGRSAPSGTRVGRNDNSSGTVFARASQPIIAGNDFVDGTGPALSFDINSLNHIENADPGRSTGSLDRFDVVGNTGPLITDNSLTDNSINGLEIRGGQLTTGGVWDDVDIVHVVTETIEIPNEHIFGGLRLRSDARGSLVVKFENSDAEDAGIVVGGTLVSASNEFVDIADRIGGSLQLVGHPDFPVVLTTLADDFAGAGFTRDGIPQVDTNGDGIATGTLAQNTIGFDGGTGTGPTFAVLPAGPEVNQGLTIDNDVNQNVPGFFEATPANGNEIGFLQSGVTVEDLVTGQILIDQDFIFQYNTYIEVGTTVTNLSATTITQPATLIADDVVESRGTFPGPNGVVNWVATSQFVNGVSVLFSALDLSSATGNLGDIRVISYLDEDVGAVGDDILVTTGTPGDVDFRAFTIDGGGRFGFSHGGFYIPDGTNLANASYAGWAADAFPDLDTQIQAGGQNFTIAGDIDLVDLPNTPDPVFGTLFGPNDVTTAFAWDTDPAAATSTITSFLELLPADPSVQRPPIPVFDAGLWNGVTVREGANDRNVVAVPEAEPARTSIFSTNAIPSQAQFLGEIAPNEQSGDENRRLGFVVDGVITTPDDVDVYSFIGESGTEVWLDIDRTANRLDTVVELIDANGRTLAASNDSILAETNEFALFSGNGLDPDAAQALNVVPQVLPVQEITISESIVDATDGDLTFSIAGTDDIVTVPFDSFLFNPAAAIETALELTFPDLGNVESSLLRRRDREVDGFGTIVREGEDFTIQLRFDPANFVARTVPRVSVSGIGIDGAAVTGSVVERVVDSQLQDAFSTNPRDAGLRVVLPGEVGTSNLYHVRIRSSNTTNPLDLDSIVNGDLLGGRTIGRYELQVRLGEVDETPGTQVRLADIRYATNGLQIIGQPLRSPLLGEEFETNAPNDTFADAQELGLFGTGNVGAAGPLQSDRLAKSFAGEIDAAGDVDWFQFTIEYQNITRDNAALYLSTVFDLDYADNFARSDLALSVFDANGSLILFGGDSNIADDLPSSATSNDTSDLSRGSAGTLDPFIGAADLLEGTYFVAVSNQSRIPFDQFINAGTTNPLLRLEPIDSVQRIVEDRIGSVGGGTASPPVLDVLFDNNSIVENTLDDVILYVNTVNGLQIVNPFTGDNLGNIGNWGPETILDIAFDNNGDLFAYTGFGPRQFADDAFNYVQIDTSDASLDVLLNGAGFETFHDVDPGPDDTALDEESDDGFVAQAIAIGEHNGTQRGFVVGNRPIPQPGLNYFQNILYSFDESSGLVQGPNFDLEIFNSTFDPPIFTDEGGAGTDIREVGSICTGVVEDVPVGGGQFPRCVAPTNVQSRQLGIGDAVEVDSDGDRTARFADGDTFTITNGVDVQTFELDQSTTLVANGSPVRDGDAINIDGSIFEFNTGTRLQIAEVAPAGTLDGGTLLTVLANNGQTITLEFTRLTDAAQGNIEIETVNLLGQPRPAAAITADVVTAINANIIGLGASASGDEVFFDTEPTLLTTTGTGISVLGDTGLTNPGAFPVTIEETSSPQAVISSLADAIRNAGISVSTSGTQLSLPNSITVGVVSGTGITFPPSSNGVTPGNVPILLLPTDTAEVLGERIVTAISAANDSNLLPSVVATLEGRSIEIVGGDIIDVSGGFVAGGVPTFGLITGIELVNGGAFAVDNNGGLFNISAGTLPTESPNDFRFDNRQIGTYVNTATDLVGLNFTGLRAGPDSVQGGELHDILFGITFQGDIYAFNTAGELQPVFAGGRSSISTGIVGAAGLDFSILDFNLWHVTDTRGADPGHGIDAIPGRRDGEAGGNSLAFNYEEDVFAGNFDSAAEVPGDQLEATFNFPGGARGVVNSNTFSLEGYSPNDEPFLYFNYFLETDGVDDELRVSVVDAEGVETGIGQPLFNNTGTWRQVRAPLADFAGESGLSLRVEFSTSGEARSSSSSLRVVAASELIEGQTFVVGGETFEIDFAPTIGVPSGVELENLYAVSTETAVVTLDGQDYVLNDGTRPVGVGQLEIDLFALAGPGATLSSLSAADVANAIAEAIRLNPPVLAVETVFFSDPQDDPTLVGTNDFIFEATPLPYSGGNAAFEGNGRFGTDPALGPVGRIDDVDLLSLDVVGGTTISVDVELDFNSALGAVVRFFDASGAEVTNGVFNNIVNGTIDFTPADSGRYFIGLSGDGNDTYDPRTPGTASNGQVDTYSARIEVRLPPVVLTDGNVIEFGGFTTVSASPSDLFVVTGNSAIQGVPVQVSRFMSANDVASVVQTAIADHFEFNTDFLPLAGASLTLPELQINNAGPFVNETVFGVNRVDGAQDNDFEGAYLDDFVIGFAERGEVASGANPTTGNFFVNPAVSSGLQTGTYQVEIRDASEFVASADATPFRTIDTNARLSESRTVVARSASEIRDGQTFSITDGRSTVDFEFDLIESDTGVTPGTVAVPFTLLAIEPDTGEIDPFTGAIIPGTEVIRAQTSTEVAQSIADAINRPDVQAVLGGSALSGSGVDVVNDGQINLFGDINLVDESGAFESVGFADLRGDQNRERDAQGVILVENSRFLFNEFYGVDISHDLSVTIDGNDEPSVVRYPRNLVELNTESLTPGVVVQSNVFAFNEIGGIQIAGIDPALNQTGNDPVAFDRILNNTIIGGSITPGLTAPSATFNGVFFGMGALAFADQVIDFSPDAGGQPPTPVHQNANAALGAPNGQGFGPEPLDSTSSVSLGVRGSLTVAFTDNNLTGSGDNQPDLIVFETGEIESVFVEVSRDGISFFDVGTVGGLVNTVDIDSFGFGPEDRFSFVRLTDAGQGANATTSLGADIDAIGALSSVPIDGFTSGGTAVNITGNASPTLLNNVFANSEQGIAVGGNNTLVLGANTFYRNDVDVPANVPFGQFAQVLPDEEVIFVGAAELIFAPAAGASIIDSSIDSLPDRASLTTVRNPLGIPASPILAPRFDVNGQLRIDDPNVETPGGLGERVFSDRGASDRGDLDGPRAILLSPQAPGIGIGAGVASVFGEVPQFFDVQLIDGLAPADVTPGVGVDDRTVTGASLLLLQDNVPLVEGIDYRFGYNPSTNIIRLTPIAGVWEPDSTYVIRVIDSSDAVIAALDGDQYDDGSTLSLLQLDGTRTEFEYETGLNVSISASVGADQGDGITVDVFDGSATITFEFDNDGIVEAGNVQVSIPVVGSTDLLAGSLADAINNTPALNVTAIVQENVIQLLGPNPLTAVTSNSPFVFSTGQIGTAIGFGIGVQTDGAAPDGTIDDGQSFIVRRGQLEVLFEFDTDGVLENAGNPNVNVLAVPLPLNPTLDQIVNAMVIAIGGSPLGLSPVNAGSGQLFLGGDASYSLDLTGTTLQQLGVPGQGPAIPIVIPINQSDVEAAATIANTIDAVGLAGVETSVVDSRVFIEGTVGVSGTGAVEIVTIADEVGNELQPNQVDGRTELTIFVGGGFDFGDAPPPFPSLDIDSGPRHGVDPNFTLGATISADSNAQINGGDDDDGVLFPVTLQAGFGSSVQVTINNPDGREFYLDAWFDWDGDGQFETVENVGNGTPGVRRFASPLLASGTNSILVDVPGGAQLGETYARFRLSEVPGLGPIGTVDSGEVEDYQIVVTSNPFQNPNNRFDVNASGATTPLDALQIINALRFVELGESAINLSDLSLPPLPQFPDVNGDGLVTAGDAIQVINELRDVFDAGQPEGELVTSSSFVRSGSGVLASTSTALGSALIAEAHESTVDNSSETDSDVSVFDSAASIQLDSVVEMIATDNAEASDDTTREAVDAVFSLL